MSENESLPQHSQDHPHEHLMAGLLRAADLVVCLFLAPWKREYLHSSFFSGEILLQNDLGPSPRLEEMSDIGALRKKSSNDMTTASNLFPPCCPEKCSWQKNQLRSIALLLLYLCAGCVVDLTDSGLLQLE